MKVYINIEIVRKAGTAKKVTIHINKIVVNG